MGIIKKLIVAGVAMAGMAASTYAASITFDLATVTVTPGVGVTFSATEGLQGTLPSILPGPGWGDGDSLLVKEEYDGHVESGPYAGVYNVNINGGANGFTITGSGINLNPVYLIIKDGNHTPAWYMFTINGWNGTDTITGSGFWTGSRQGAISFVGLYGSPPQVPDGGATLALFGLALGMVGWFGRKLRA